MKYSSDKQSSIQGFFLRSIKLGFTYDLQWVLFYTMMFVSCILDFLFVTTEMTDWELNCQLASQLSTNRVDEDFF